MACLYLSTCTPAAFQKTISSTSQRITAHRLPLQIKSIYSRFTITPLLQKHIFSAICIFFSMHLPRTEAIRYIQGQYPNIRSLDEVSAFCNISRSHLGRLFRTNLHMSAQDYLIETRLNQARKMLTTTTIPVSEIAWRVGYQNELNLFRAFKNKYGMPPNTYRKQNTF